VFTMKKCTACCEVKDYSEYSKDKKAKDGFRSKCRSCRVRANMEWRKANPEKRRQQNERYKERCKQKTHTYTSKKIKKCPVCGEAKVWSDYYKCSSDPSGLGPACKLCTNKKVKLWESENKSRVLGYKVAWAKENRGLVRETQRRWIQNNPEKVSMYWKSYREDNRLLLNLRQRIKTYLFERGTNEATRELLGCSDDHFRAHMESQFKEGMSWDNYGKDGWHIDHIRPCASFDLTDMEQVKQCFHYTNLQPLWAFDNISKGSSYKGERYLRGARVARNEPSDTR